MDQKRLDWLSIVLFYLLGGLFQAGVVELYAKIGNGNVVTLIFFILSVLCGLYIPVWIEKSVKRMNFQPLIRVLGFS
jgi:hypothetical protein